ncbi:DUF4870 domain-containing protein [Salisediminibacterium halotolerans]|uniref:DUF4870 domain-containing protein n=1 Tax=Salisediminibacterium halotolerans TaxID=517425 RepID=UPI000B81A85E|nr:MULTISPECIES: DUF4870 domain-containing protein [Salisediminibacterium]
MELTNDERLLAMLIYLISFFTAFIGPLIIWLIKKNDSDFIDFHGRQYLNLFISSTIYFVISAILAIIVIGLFLSAIVGLWVFIITIVAAVKAFSGEYYRIPFTIKFL